MIRVNASQDNILSINVSNKLTKGDLDDLVPLLKEKVAESDHPHLLMILEDFNGWKNAETFWKDLKLDNKYIGSFDRIAVVGEKKWQKWGTKLVNPITKEELKYFPIDQLDNAWEWISKEHEKI